MRHLWLAFVLALAVTLFGFWPTTVGPFGPPDGVRIVHGLFAAGWMVLLIVQAWTIGQTSGRGADRRLRRWHRWIGWSSLILAPGLVISALVVVVTSQGLGHFDRDLLLTLDWIDLWSLALFAGLYAAGIAFRKTMSLHARYLASTVFVALIPALGRIYGMNIEALGGLTGALHPSFVTVELILTGLIVRDALRHGGLRARYLPPYAITLAMLLGIEVTMFAAPRWSGFAGFMQAIG